MYIFPKDSRVIFTGDSITAQTKYTTRIVEYYRKHLPELNVKFGEGAVSGSTLNAAIRFFKDMILPMKPTHATVFYGINDCGLGFLNKEDKEEKYNALKKRYEDYKNNLSTFIDMLTAHGITPILITPAPYAEFLPGEGNVWKDGQKLSYEYAEVVRGEAKKRGLELIDLHARIAELYMHDDVYCGDRVHPTDHGQYRIAECILRSQGLTIDDYRPLDEILANNEELKAWQTAAYRIGRIYGMYVCVKGDLYDMPLDKQLDYVGEYVISRGYGANNVARDFSTEFVYLKPRESELWDKIHKFNGDL